MIEQEIVHEIDKTLDQLIRNAEMISGTEINELTDTELNAFQKTQESLLHHLLAMDQRIAVTQSKPEKLKAVRAKRKHFEELQFQVDESIGTRGERRPLFSKRRGKRFFDLRARRKKVLISRV